MAIDKTSLTSFEKFDTLSELQQRKLIYVLLTIITFWDRYVFVCFFFMCLWLCDDDCLENWTEYMLSCSGWCASLSSLRDLNGSAELWLRWLPRIIANHHRPAHDNSPVECRSWLAFGLASQEIYAACRHAQEHTRHCRIGIRRRVAVLEMEGDASAAVLLHAFVPPVPRHGRPFGCDQEQISILSDHFVFRSV